jgi:RNA polymerase sigma factor for flagellar operon FliA
MFQMTLIMKTNHAYQEQQTDQKQELIVNHVSMVKRIAWHLKSRLPANILLDDLIQAGMIGLLEAANYYDASQGARFDTYASIRIRGAMLDEIRKNDWAPRSVHRNCRWIAEVVRQIENEQGRDARDSEIADAMGLELEDYYRILQDVSGQKLFSFEDVGHGEENFLDTVVSPQDGVLDCLQKEELRQQVSEAIAGLPEREKLVMALYYTEELNLREIGAVIGVTESRVSQIHSQAIIRLQARLFGKI